ncbi:unnamed protein product, partial [Effrenium voratum]
AVTHQRDALLEETTTAAKEKEWLIAKVAQLTVANTEQQNAIAKLEDFNSGWQIAYKNVTASATTTTADLAKSTARAEAAERRQQEAYAFFQREQAEREKRAG